MKRIVVFLLAAAIAPICPAQTPAAPPHHSLSLEADVSGSGGASKAKTGLKEDLGGKPLGNGWSTSEQKDYNSSRNKKSGVDLEVEVHNLAAAPDSAKLEWYFIGEPVGKDKPFIYDQGSQDVTLTAGQSQSFPLEAKELTEKDERHLHIDKGLINGRPVPPAASTKKKGSKFDGWMVRLVADGQILAVRASSPALEELGKNDAALASYPKHEKK
jgi:hypothetical protein